MQSCMDCYTCVEYWQLVSLVCVMNYIVGGYVAFLASGSDPTDERCMKHGPQTTPRRGRRELAACVVD